MWRSLKKIEISSHILVPLYCTACISCVYLEIELDAFWFCFCNKLTQFSFMRVLFSHWLSFSWSILIYLFIYIFSCIFYIFLISSKRFLLLFKGDLYEVYPWVEEGVDDLRRSVHLHGVRDPVPPPLGRDLYLIHKAQHQSCILYLSQSLF